MVGLVVFLAGCQATSKENKEAKVSSAKQAVSVAVVHAIEQQPVYKLKLPGELHPYESVDVFAKVKGFVRKIHVDVGSKVRKGQVLAVLEAPEMDLQSTVDGARSQQLGANYEVSRRRYERLRKVKQESPGAVSELEYEQAYGAMLRDSSALLEGRFSHRKTNQLREYLIVRAPFSGVITERNFSVGALIGDSGVPFFKLVDNDRLKLKVVVPEVHAQSVSDSTQAEFSVLSNPTKVFHAKLLHNAQVIDPLSSALALEFDVPNHADELNGGDYTDVNLQLKRNRPTLFVPKSSIINAQAGVFVLRLVQQQIERVPVKLGQSQEDLQEIFGDLSPNDQLVLKASEELANGQKVNIVK